HHLRQWPDGRRVASNVTVLKREAREATAEQTGQRTAQAVVLVPRDRLVAEPEEASRARALGEAGAEEGHVVVRVAAEPVGDATAKLAVEVRPRLRVMVVVLERDAVVEQRVER